MYLRSHAQKYMPGVYLHVCKLYTRVNLAHANWTIHHHGVILKLFQFSVSHQYKIDLILRE